MKQLTSEQQIYHLRAIEISREYCKLEWLLIEVLQNVERTKVYRSLGYSSLFKYAVEALSLSESVTYSFILVARKATEIPKFKSALEAGQLAVPRASRIVSAITHENAGELIAFAKTHSRREVDFEVARLNPSKAPREKIKPISEDRAQASLTLARRIADKLKRAQTVAGTKNLEDTIEAALDLYLRHKDPVEKAKRALARPKLCLDRVRTKTKLTGRQRLTAKEKYAVFARDEGRCTFKDASGQRCDNEKWPQVHHIQMVSQGGGNDPENLTTLCSFHHDLVHQLTLPLEEQFTWLRSPQTSYVA